MNDNQNIHVQSRGRSSSRVLAPPGGVCSITLGVSPPPKVVVTKTESVPVFDVRQPEGVAKIAAVSEAKKEEEPRGVVVAESVATAASALSSSTIQPTVVKPMQVAQQQPPVSANAFASGARANGANVMTGRPTSRVLAPPGGHCSITLG